MKVLNVGDMHLTGDRPINRKDDYWETCKGKAEFIFETANQRGADIIISPGDVTDTPSLSYLEFTELVRLFHLRLPKEISFVCTYGQHDMRYRTRPNTALAALHEAIENFFVLTTQDYRMNLDGVYLQGCAYNEDPPLPEKDGFNILTIHRMIIDHKLWSKQEEYESSNLFLRNQNFDLIVSGDNHQPFDSHTPGGRWLFNCGAMMRNKIDQVDHKPYVVLFDTETKAHEKIYIPIQPPEDVFRLEKVAIEKERNEELEAFIVDLKKAISSGKEKGLSFADSLRAYLKKNNIDEEVARIALDSIGEKEA